MKTKDFLGMLLTTFLVVAGLTACSDDDNGGDEPNPNPPTAVTITRTFYDVEVDYAIEAKDKSGIESDLSANRPLPEDAQYGTTSRNIPGLVSTLTLERVTKKDTTSVGYIRYMNKEPEAFPETYKLLLPDESISGYMEWTLCSSEDFNDVLVTYDVFVHSSIPGGNGVGGVVYLYEDLTAKYKEMFPDAGVTAVVRRQTLTFKSKEEIK